MAFGHGRTDVNGINVLFGGAATPVINAELQNLVWRFTDANTNMILGAPGRCKSRAHPGYD